MSKEITNNEVRDTNTYTDDDAAVSNAHGIITYQLINNLDQSISYTVYGTHGEDTNFDEAGTLTSGTLSSGSVTFETTASLAVDILRVEYSASSSPSSGAFKVLRMSRGA